MLNLDELDNIYETNKEAFLQDWFQFLSFKSISSEEDYKKEVVACQKWLESYLGKLGFKAEVWETSGHPVIFAKTPYEKKDCPTLLFYNHYDVQPVDPEEEWKTPPFEPTVVNGEVFARGAQDNKGQAFYTFLALAHLVKNNPDLPLNIKFCIEGEEEVGSYGLSSILKEKKEDLKCDALVITDVLIPNIDTPAITLGVRGILTFDIEMIGSNSDLHSGCHGGIVYNPIHALVELLGKLRSTKTGQILVPGFYDGVMPLDEEEKKQFDLSFNEKEYQTLFAARPCGGEKQYPPGDRVSIRPTLEINGIKGGYTGKGFKTVIPQKATAKLSCRLVPGQDGKKVAEHIKNFLSEYCPEGIQLSITPHHGGNGVRANPNAVVAKSFSHAFEQVFKKPTKNILSGASIPIAAEMGEILDTPVVLTGLGLPEDNIHAPNEHFGLERFKKGFLITALAAQEFATSQIKKEVPCD